MRFVAERGAPGQESTSRTRTAGSKSRRSLSMRTFRMNEASSTSYSSRFIRLLHAYMRVGSAVWSLAFCQRMRRQSCRSEKNCIVCLYICLAASVTSRDVRGASFSVRGSLVSVSVWDTVWPATIKTFTMIVIVLTRPSAHSDTTPASFAYGIRHTALCTQVRWSTFTPFSPRSS